MTTDPLALADLAEELARTAGATLRERPRDLGTEAKSSPTDVVTVMDRRSERVIVEGLLARRPDDRVVAEESGDNDRDAEVTWYVDPLDGTVNYLYGLPQFAVSIAAAINGDVVAGVVYDVARDEIYRATCDGGATRDGQPLRCTTQADPAFALVATGFAYSAATRSAQADVVRALLPQVRDIRRLGSAALDLCAVAAGHVDAYYELGMHVWDWAAGALIAREAGARVERYGDMMVAANPELFDALHAMVVDTGA